MDGLLAYCGIACAGCPVYWATVEADPVKKAKLRATIARVATEEHGMRMEAAEVPDCDGCTSESGRLFSTCSDCGVRACARERGLETCAYCSDYPCDRALEVFKVEPSAKTRLDVIRSSL
jgi:hypothetical protein